jgi:hypothetical protein
MTACCAQDIETVRVPVPFSPRRNINNATVRAMAKTPKSREP